jgi:hypothetical protein
MIAEESGITALSRGLFAKIETTSARTSMVGVLVRLDVTDRTTTERDIESMGTFLCATLSTTCSLTNTERSTHPPSSNAYRSSGSVHAADGPTDDLAGKGAAAFREVKASVESVIADAGDKGQQAWDYAGKKGRKRWTTSVKLGTRLPSPSKDQLQSAYTTLALAVAAGFLFGDLATLGEQYRVSPIRSRSENTAAFTAVWGSIAVVSLLCRCFSCCLDIACIFTEL